MNNLKITYSKARENLAGILDKVSEDAQVFVIKRRNHKDVALIAAEELSSLLESVYLLRSPENAKGLWRSIEWSKSNDLAEQSLEELKEELGIGQEERIVSEFEIVAYYKPF